MTTLNLKSLQAKTEKKHPALKIEVDVDGGVELLTFRNILRLPKDDRKAFKKIQDARAAREAEIKAAEGDEEKLAALEAEDSAEDTIQYFRDALTLVADKKGLCKVFLDEVGDDLAVLATVFESYVKNDPELGEGSSSES